MLTLVEAMYAALRPMLFRLDPETAHRLTLAFFSSIPAFYRPWDAPELAVSKWSVSFPNPVGLAAGADKDIRAVAGWNALGFGFMELGTVTPRPQPGNESPRLWRLPEHRAVINRLGFPSEGMKAAEGRLRALRRDRIGAKIGINFGPNKDTPTERVAEDYAILMRNLGAFAEFVVVNLSSPNTPGLRDWQAPERIREIIEAMRRESTPHRPPVLVKVAPDLGAAQLDAVCDAALAIDLDGIVATNTTLAREEVDVSSALPGGLSGRPLLERSRAAIRAIYRRTGGKLPIIGVGGIASAEDAYAHIRAGASLVEFYTGLIYEGPGLVGSIKAGLRRLLARDGFRSISDAVGADAGDVRST